MILFRLLSLSLLILAGQSSAAPLLAQESTSHTPHHSFHDVQIGTERVAEGIFMLTGEGGNIGVSAGEDGVFLIDDQFAPLTDMIRKAIAAISPEPIKFLLNTHWHIDHTGGNENLGKAGVLIVAHDNVRVRMSSEQFQEAFDRKVPPSPHAALPVVTFSDAVTFHVNGEEIYTFRVPPAHTDGDSVIHFRKSNVVHTGDLFTTARYPFIDLSSGGTVDGMIEAANRLLEIVDSGTKVIPGHGPLGDREALKDYRAMLLAVRDRVKEMIDSGKTVEEVVQAKPTKEFDSNRKGGFLKPDDFARLIYDSLKQGP